MVVMFDESLNSITMCKQLDVHVRMEDVSTRSWVSEPGEMTEIDPSQF